MLKEYLRNGLPVFGDDMLRTGGIGEWPAPAAEVEQTRAAQRLVAQARWRCDNDAANLKALTQLVEQLEDVNKDVGIASLRWNVNLLGTGVGWVTADFLDRLQALGCSIQLSSNNWVNSSTPTVIAGHAYRTINQHPIHKSLFSNATHISPLNPWLHLYYVVTGVNSYGQQVNPDEHLTREEALRLRTRESSWHLQMEDRLGTIEAGKLADLAVLDRDYFSVPDVEIKDPVGADSRRRQDRPPVGRHSPTVKTMLPTERFTYSAIVDRPRLRLPGGARLAVWVIVNVEEWNPLEPMPRTVLTPPAGGSPMPDIPNWAWHEYGNRVGFWRMLEVFDRFRDSGGAGDQRQRHSGL